MGRSLYDSLIPEITADMLQELLDNIEHSQRVEWMAHDAWYHNEVGPIVNAEMTPEYLKERVSAFLPVPIGRLIVNKIVTMAYNRSVDRSTGVPALDAALASFFRGQARSQIQIATTGSVFGCTMARVRHSWVSGLEIWDCGGPLSFTPILDPENPHGPILGVVYHYFATDPNSQVLHALGKGGIKAGAKDVKDVFTRCIRRSDGSVYRPGIRARFVDGKRELIGANDDGLNYLGDFLDGVFWRNEDDYNNSLGYSDIEAVVKLIRGFLEFLADGNSLVKFNVWPMLWTNDAGTGFKKTLKYVPGGVLQMGTDSQGMPATLNKLEWSENMSGFHDFYDRLKQLIHETSCVPASSVGDLEHIGQISSGIAYEIAMTPITELVARREIIYTDQEGEEMETAVAHLVAKQLIPGWQTFCSPVPGASWPMPDALKIRQALAEKHIEFGPLRLVKDFEGQARYHATLVSAGLESVETALGAIHPEWSPDDIKAELERLKTSAEEKNATQVAFMEAMSKRTSEEGEEKEPKEGEEDESED